MKLDKKLIRGSILLLIGINFFSLMGFIFQLVMARSLSLEDYGILAVLFSILYFYGLFSESLQTIVAKYSSRTVSDGYVKTIFGKILTKSLRLSFILFLAYLIIAIPLAHLTKISYLLLAFSGLFIFPALLIPLARGVLQGREFFPSLGLNLIYEGILKLGGGILFAYLGWRVYGAVGAAMLATFLAFLISLISLRTILRSKREPIAGDEIRASSRPIFIVIFTIMIFYSIDVVIARIVFDPIVAGHYAIASVISKSIFWGTQPISKALFPLSNNSAHKSRNLLLNAVFFVSLMVICAWALFFLFNDYITFIFSGKNLPESASILLYIGIGMGLTALSNLVLIYKLSVNKTKGYMLIPLVLIVQIMLLMYFSTNLTSFSLAFIAASVLFLLASIFLLRPSNSEKKP